MPFASLGRMAQPLLLLTDVVYGKIVFKLKPLPFGRGFTIYLVSSANSMVPNAVAIG